MDTSWNIGALRAHMRSLGDDQKHLIEIVDSLDRSTRIFRYHLFTARDALKGLIDQSDPAGIESFKFVIGASDRQDDYAQSKLISEAHIIACINTARSMFDIFSNLLNGLILGSRIETDCCNIHVVYSHMPDSELRQAIKALLSSDWFKYISAFINTAKHRRLVKHSFSVSFVSEQAGVLVGAFEHKGRTYPQYWGSELLQGILDVKNQLVACGQALNRECAGSNA